MYIYMYIYDFFLHVICSLMFLLRLPVVTSCSFQAHVIRNIFSMILQPVHLLVLVAYAF